MSQAVLRQSFAYLLWASTLIPFFAGVLLISGSQPPALIQVIEAIALIHVPLTIYLFTDAAMFERIRRHPVVYVLVPVLLIAGSAFYFLYFGNHPARGSALFFAVYGIVCWQSWHFGRQNLGICTFCRMSVGADAMRKMERRLIVAGAISGVIAVWGVEGRRVMKTYAGGWSLPEPFAGGMDFVVQLGEVAAYGILLVSIAHVVRNRSRYGWLSASIFLVSANFFLPQYWAIAHPAFLTVFTTSVMAHGTQYALILGYHALSSSAAPADRSRISSRWLRAALPITGFVAAVWFSCELYLGRGPAFNLRGPADRLLVDLLGLQLDAHAIGTVALGAMFGILMSHFWIDTFVWRLSTAEGRKWAQQTFWFVMPSGNVPRMARNPDSTDDPDGKSPAVPHSSAAL